MATTVNWLTGEISIPRADMPVIQVAPEIRQLDTAQLWLDLKDLEAAQEGMPWTDTQSNNPAYTISGFTYAQGFRIIAPYFITFEDGQYGVALTGTNNNVLDVATANQVRILSQNSGGLIFGRLTPADVAQLFTYVVENGETFEQQLRLLRAAAAGRIAQAPDGSYIIYGEDGATPRIQGDDAANSGRDITSTDGT